MGDKANDDGLPVAPIHRLIKQVTGSRVSAKASVELKAILERHGESLSARAVELAGHRNKDTVNVQDVRLAYKLSLQGKTRTT